MGKLTYPVYLLHQDIGFVIVAGTSPSIGDLGAKTLAFFAVALLAVGVQATDDLLPWNNKRRQLPKAPLAT